MAHIDDRPWPLTHFVRATHDYAYPQHGFLPLRRGDIVYVVDEDASGWWFGINTRGERGVFPCTYATRLAPRPPRAGTLTHAKIAKLARRSGVDLVSGSPLPLIPLQGVPIASGSSCQQDALQDTVKAALLRRDEHRQDVLNVLHCLSSSQRRQATSHVPTPTMRPDKGLSLSSVQKPLQEARQDVGRSLARLCHQLDKYVAVCVTAVPPPSWYRALHELLQRYSCDTCKSGNASDETVRALCTGSAAVDTAPDSLARRRGDVAAVLTRRHGDLQTRLLAVRAREAEYVRRKSQLVHRIAIRDAAVSRLLQDWRARMQQTRVLYRNESQSVRQYKQNSEDAKKQLQKALDVAKANYATLLEAWQETLRRQATLAQAIRTAHEQLAVLDARLKADGVHMCEE